MAMSQIRRVMVQGMESVQRAYDRHLDEAIEANRGFGTPEAEKIIHMLLVIRTNAQQDVGALINTVRGE